MFLKNTWYVAATSDQIDAQFADGAKPLARTICNERMVFYRGDNGVVAALEDFCPHRGAPLSLGRVTEGKLMCGYHGLHMGCEGKAVSMPGQNVQNFRSIRAFPAVERYGFIWVWLGEAALATPDSIPHLDWYNNPEWAFGGGHFNINCDYRLMIDNLMDLTHETYVHSNSIGQKEIDEVPCQTELKGNEVVTSRFMHNIEPPPFWKLALRGNHLADDVLVDRWQICRFTPPSNVHIEVGVAHVGHGGYDAPAAHKVYSVVVDFITPETDTSMHYFWGMARKFNPSDAALTDTIRAGQNKIFSEDLQMLEMQQKNLSTHPTRRLMTLNIDAGGSHSRKVIERLLAEETAQQNKVTA